MKLPSLSPKSIILAITFLAFLLRAYRLDAQSYWIDEAWSLTFANFSPAELWHWLTTVEPHPPLYHLPTLFWLRLAGDNEYALRFFSLLFGVMAVPFTYRLGQALGSARLGWIAALLMAVAPFQIWHSQEARMYSELTAASVMSMWGFVSWYQHGGRRGWAIYVVGTTWLLLTHYLGLFLIGIQGLFLLLTWPRYWRSYLRFGATLSLIFLLITPWIVLSDSLRGGFLSWVEQPTLWDSFVRSAIVYSLNKLVPVEQALPLTLVFVAAYLLGLIYATRRRWGGWTGGEMLAFLVSYTLIPNLVAWLYGEIRTTVYLERYLIFVQPGFLLTVAIGVLAVANGLPRLIGHLRKREVKSTRWGQRAAALLLLALISINGWVLYHHYFDPLYAKPDWRAVARTIEAFEQPGDAILLTGDGGEQAFDFYYHGNLPVYASFNIPIHQPVPRPEGDEALEILTGITTQHERLWYTPYGMELDPLLESWLAQNTHPAWQRWLGRKRLALYDTQPPAGRTETLNAPFPDASGQGPTLLRLTLPDEPIPAGDLLPLTLTWQTDTPLPYNAQLSLRLLNQRGDIFAQSDWPPLAAGQPTSNWPVNQPITDRRSLWIPPDVPPGDYVLQGVVYDPAAGPLGQPVILSAISVAPAPITPPPDSLPIPNATRHALGDLLLVGYVAPDSLQPGRDTWLWLYAQAENSLDPGTALRITLRSDDEIFPFDIPLNQIAGPLDAWQPGQIRRMIVHLPTSPRLNGEQVELAVALVNPDGQATDSIELAAIRLETRPRHFDAPAIAHPTDISLADLLNLAGYDLPQTTLSPGDTLPLTLYWQAEMEMSADYTVFVQLLNSQGQVVGQVDAQPLAGAAPTTTWLPGEILTDAYTLPLPHDLPPGQYRLITGMYNAAAGRRLPVSTGGDFVELPPVTVE